MIYGLRRFTATTQTFWGCDETDTGGVLGVRIYGVGDFTGDTLASANGFTGLVTATGLSAGTYTYQMMLNGSLVGSAHQFTLYASGDEFSILFIGDTNLKVDEAFTAITGRESSVAAVIGSELFYLDGNAYGAIYTDANDYNDTASFPASQQAVRDSMRSAYRNAYAAEPARLTLEQKWPLFNSPGNHDLLISDPGPGPGYPTLHKPGLCRYDGAHEAAINYASNGTPPPSGTVDSEPSPVLYYDFTVGDVHIIVLDALTYSNPFAQGNLHGSSGNGSTAGDDAQVAWLKSVINASTANVIIINHGTVVRGEEWANDLFSWLDTNYTDKTFLIMAADTHVAYVIAHDGSIPNYPITECGYSPSSAVTSSKTFFLAAGDVPHMADNLLEKTTLTANTDGSLVIAVEDSSPFRTKPDTGEDVKVIFGNNSLTRGVATVDSATQITLTSTVPVDAYAAGTEVYVVDWPRVWDVDNITDPTNRVRRANYARVTRKPNGTHLDSNPHTEVELIETYTGGSRFKFRVRDGERFPRWYRFNGKQVQSE